MNTCVDTVITHEPNSHLYGSSLWQALLGARLSETPFLIDLSLTSCLSTHPHPFSGLDPKPLTSTRAPKQHRHRNQREREREREREIQIDRQTDRLRNREREREGNLMVPCEDAESVRMRVPARIGTKF